MFASLLFQICFKKSAVSRMDVVRSVSSDSSWLNKVVILSKMTRWELEKMNYPDLSEGQFMDVLKKRGSDIKRLIAFHDSQKEVETIVTNTLQELKIESRTVNRLTYKEEDVAWADAVIPVGGDGTFLVAASKVLNRKKPVIGFNSDLQHSKGHLCLPKNCSLNPRTIKETLEKLKQGQFSWMYRTRIRTTLNGDGEPPVELHYRRRNLYQPRDEIEDGNKSPKTIVLPELALNEVFAGELLSARVSNIDLKVDDANEIPVKCSGMLVSTGTGSTSWHYTHNQLATQTVRKLLSFAGADPNKAYDVARTYNSNLIFNPEDPRLGFTVRDIIEEDPSHIPSGFADKVTIKSKCLDASLVIDGGMSYNFNEGTVAMFETRPEDALKTVVLTP
ncbi:unnamed protein product [Bemisia tabaci]|uniref:NAD(+) kinase n=1 Tax=Bemisia tabaci TaxID=7038 RepID=A0A9P0F916_BEMTA|nr:PREDICTED: NAD kinase 2, mitochondrial isoform X2 [Bemisia tabaci]CAH0394897.1 unnamed protein product [Bemisia tabaci]